MRFLLCFLVLFSSSLFASEESPDSPEEVCLEQGDQRSCGLTQKVEGDLITLEVIHLGGGFPPGAFVDLTSRARQLRVRVTILQRDATAGIVVVQKVSPTMRLTEPRQSSRSWRRLGAYVGILDPFASLVSLNLGYHVGPLLRVFAGAGLGTGSSIYRSDHGRNYSDDETYGGGIKLFVPDWNFSPTAGLGISSAVWGGSRDLILTASGGLDWVLEDGLHVAVGLHFPFSPGKIRPEICPYLNIGIFGLPRNFK